MIDFTCGECNTAMRANDDDGGKKTMCPECGARTKIPPAPGRIALKLQGPLVNGLFAFGCMTIGGAILGALLAIGFLFNGAKDAPVLLFLCIVTAGMGLSCVGIAYVLTYLRYLADKASN